MRRALAAALAVCLLAGCLSAAGTAFADNPGRTDGAASGNEIMLEPVLREPASFTNVLFHYVVFDAEVRNAERVTLRVLDPEREAVAFRTRTHVNNGWKAVRTYGVSLKKGQEKIENLNVLFPSGLAAGTWIIEVTASAAKAEPVTAEIPVRIRNPVPLSLNRLGEARSMLTGTESAGAVPAEKGRIRFVAQDPEDPLFVKDYWFSGMFDLRPTANQKCTRAVFSMALSWLGVDCTPIRMSELLVSREIFYTYDPVCRALGNVTRVKGDLDTLWEEYEAGRASPVLLHFRYDDGMHAVLLIARESGDPEVFYAVTTGQRVNTSAFPDGAARDMILPIRIEKGEKGERIQCPLLRRYHKGVIDEIWQWKLTEDPATEI